MVQEHFELVLAKLSGLGIELVKLKAMAKRSGLVMGTAFWLVMAKQSES